MAVTVTFATARPASTVKSAQLGARQSLKNARRPFFSGGVAPLRVAVNASTRTAGRAAAMDIRCEKVSSIMSRGN